MQCLTPQYKVNTQKTQQKLDDFKKAFQDSIHTSTQPSETLFVRNHERKLVGGLFHAIEDGTTHTIPDKKIGPWQQRYNSKINSLTQNLDNLGKKWGSFWTPNQG